MHKLQQQVLEFHKAFDILINYKPTLVDEKTQELRKALILEEMHELFSAMANDDLVKIADGLADLLYVVYGSAVSYGLDLEDICDEVHRSNMTKVGGTKREDGKLLKPKSYQPPNLLPIIQAQSYEFKVGAKVKIRNSNLHGKIVEFCGNLGPNGTKVYGISYGEGQYIEVLEERLELQN